MWAAASHPGGFGGVPHSVGKEFANADPGGHLPEHVKRALGGIGMAKSDPLGSLAHATAVKGIGSGGGMKGGFGSSSSTQTPFWTRSAARQMDGPSAKVHFDTGGSSFGSEVPWTERSDAHLMDQTHNGGLIGSSTAGRTDRIPMSVPADSHVMTADVVSGLGQGNTLSGGRNLMQALRVGPWGMPLPHEVHGHGPPAAPHLAAGTVAQAHGGHPRRAQILAAGGEFVVPGDWWTAIDPDDGKRYLHRGVKQLGLGDSKKGHEALDRLMKNVREFNIHWLKHAPPPKK